MNYEGKKWNLGGERDEKFQTIGIASAVQYQKWFENPEVVANGIDALGRSHFQIMASVQFPRWVE